MFISQFEHVRCLMFKFHALAHCSLVTEQLGAKDCTPEISTSEVIVDFQWHVSLDFQRHFPVGFDVSAVVSKGLSLPQWIFTGDFQWINNSIFQWIFTFVISGV